MSTQPIGNKARNLKWLQDEIGHVPPFLTVSLADVVTHFDAAQQGIASVLRSAAQAGDAAGAARAIAAIIDAALLPDERLLELRSEISALGSSAIIFRTSAALEDLRDASFAGMYESIGPLVPASDDEIRTALTDCWKSIYAERVLAYLTAHKAAWGVQDFCVIVQQFFGGEMSGVAFADPSTGTVELAFGNGAQAVVTGADAKMLFVDGAKKSAPSEIAATPLFAVWAELSGTFAVIAKKKGQPQDIEWAVGGGAFAIVQTRDITARHQAAVEEVWDNTNISESYPGITSPLTFSFIRHAYSQVYPSFLRSIGVPEFVLTSSEPVFSGLLGHLRGQVYYNVGHWYSLVRLLPGYRYNKDFFEAMWNPIKKNGEAKTKPGFLQAVKLAPLAARFAWKLFRARGSVRRFVASFERDIRRYREVDMTVMAPAQLAAHYRDVEETFFCSWSVPIMNDFRVMIFHGLLRKMVAGRNVGESDRLVGALLTEHASLMSIEPIRRLFRLSDDVVSSDRLAVLFRSAASDSEILTLLGSGGDEADRRVLAGIKAYIEEFGARNPAELKLESPTMTDNPSLAVGLLRKYVVSGRTPLTARAAAGESLVEAEKIVCGNGGAAAWLKWLLARGVLATAKDAVAAREHMRMLRSRVYSYAKSMFVQFGLRLIAAGGIAAVDDVFYLTREELLEWAQRPDAESARALGVMAGERRRTFVEYRAGEALPRRVKTFAGPLGVDYVGDEVPAGNNGLRGIPASAGIVRGKVLCLKEFDASRDFSDSILVTVQTDPGWTTVFPFIRGLVTERGNILSHAAIVSRELRIPSVVSVKGATDVLKDGDFIEVNGHTGEIIKLNDTHAS